jgi:hypothetical protein
MSYQQAVRVSTVLALLEATRILATRNACQEDSTSNADMQQVSVYNSSTSCRRGRVVNETVTTATPPTAEYYRITGMLWQQREHATQPLLSALLCHYANTSVTVYT